MENKPSAGVSMGMIPSSDLDNGIAQPEKIQGSEPGVKKLALEIMWQEIRTLTSSMTSVPIPLEFLCPHYGALKTYYITMEDSDLKKYLADILSVLALTMSAERERESLKYRLLGSEGDIGSRGHEYVRNLAGEISQEYTNRQQQEEATIDDLMELIHQIVAFHIKHNAEPESVDLLMEESVDPPAEVFKTFHEKIKKYCDIALLACAYAGTGNVLKVQHLLGQCAQHLEEGETHQGPAMLGIAKVAMTEELGLEMAIRSLEHLLQYGEQNICHAVPLALGLLCISNPKVNVMDTLSRLSHEIDSGVAMVRIAQALVHMGKGFLTLASEPFLPSSAYLKMDQGGQRFDKTGTTVIALISKAGIYFIHDGIAPDDTGELGPAPDDLKGGLISDLPNIMYVLTYGCAPMLAEVRQHALEFVHEQRALHAISPTIDEVVRFVSGYLHRDYTGNGVGTLIIGGFHGGIPRIAVVKRKRNGHSSYQWNPRFACAGGGAGAARTYLCTVNEEDGYLGHLHEAMARASLADPNTGGTITTRLMSSSTDINVLSRFNVHLFGIGE